MIDAVRGFALAGVALVHMLEQYVAAPYPASEAAVLTPGLIDQVIGFASSMLLTGKFYVLFSMLFGLSFFLRMDRARQRGKAFHGRFAWRLAILFVIGFIHHFFYRGDILMIYAVVGMVLLALYSVPRAGLFTIVALLFLGSGRYVAFALVGGGSVTGGEPTTSTSPHVEAYFEVLRDGSLTDVFAVNAVDGLRALVDFQCGFFGRVYITLGLFLVGLWLGRTRFFEDLPRRRKSLKWWLLASLGAAVVFFAAMGLLIARLGQPVSFDSWTSAFMMTSLDLFNLALAAVYLFTFLLIYQRQWGEKVLRVFAPYGRCALSNYVLQSLIGTFVFYGWGLGRLGEWRNLYALLAAPGVIVLQLALSRLWMKRFLYGPLEWLWRSLTYAEAYPFRRRDDAMTQIGGVPRE